MTLEVKPEPCQTCPYRCDVPSGVWAWEEYEKLRAFDDNSEPAIALFLCHQSTVAKKDIVCKGWVIVAQDSIAVRLAQMTGKLDETCFSLPTVKLHESGNAAADFGQRDIDKPKKAARKAVAKLTRQRNRKRTK